MIYQIPSLEQIYNEYHKQTFFVMNGTYPKTIVNYDKFLKNQNAVELVKKFQNLLARNRDAIDWKLYIEALAQHFKTRFDLRYLSNLAGIKTYRSYVQSKFQNTDDETKIYNQIVASLVFLSGYLKANELTIQEYYNLDIQTIPVALKHIYAGTVSLYFYAALDPYKVGFEMLNYSNDLFLQYFSMNKDQFMENYIINKHKEILKYKKIKEIMEKLQKTFK